MGYAYNPLHLRWFLTQVSGAIQVRATITVIWGSLDDPSSCLAATREVAVQDDFRSGDAFVHVEVGPVSVDGPVLALMHETSPERIFVQADTMVPDWVSADLLREWGWRVEDALPHFQHRAQHTDVLLLAPTVTGGMQGWSSQQWLMQRPVALQRMFLPISYQPDVSLPVRVLETGVDRHDLPTVVLFCPDREPLDEIGVTHFGWRREPWVKLRRNIWNDLAMASDAWETKVHYLLGQPIVERMIAHDAQQVIPRAVLDALPDDVQVAFEEYFEEN